MTEGTSTSGVTAETETAGPVAAVAASAASAAAPAPAPAPVDAQAAAMAAAAAVAAAPSAPAAPPAAPAVGPTAAAIAAAETAAAIEAAAAKKADKAKKDDSDSDETSMSDAEVLAEVELATLGDSGAAGQAGLPCGVLPVVDAPVVSDVPPPVVVPVGDSGFAFSPALLALLGLGALGLGYLLLKGDDDDDDDVDEVPNEPPVAADDAVTVNEDATVTGSVATNDSDPDGAAGDLTYALNGTAPAGLTFNADGSFTFNAGDAAYQDLGVGETETVTVNYTVTDDDGGTDTATLTITINGVNDAPVAADDTNTAVEGGAAVTGNVSTNDSDPDGDALTYALAAPVAGLTLNADGTYSFDPSNPAYLGLAEGETQTVVATVNVSDGNGGTDTSTLTITVTGANEAPVLTAPAVADVDENMPAGTIVLDASATDADGDDIVFSLEGEDAEFFNIDPVTGVVTTDASFDAETQATYNITVVATDESGATDTQAVVVTVNDLPEVVVQSLDIDNDANTLTPFTFDAGAEWYQFMDDDDIANNIVLTNFGAEDYIVFDAPFTGLGAVAFSSQDTGDGDGLDDLLITTNVGGTVTEIRIEDVATGIVFDEATAEAAVAGDNTFRTTGEAGAMTSLDADDDADLSTANIIDAGGGNITYFDDVDIANTTTVTGFDDGDLITTNADGTTLVASFANIGDADSDGFGDLMITINNDGVLSVTVLEDAIAADAVVTNEATAEAAIGFDFFAYA